MDKKPNANHPRTIKTQDVKRLILVLSLSSTLGFWALFSNQLTAALSQAAPGDETASGSVPPIQGEDSLALDLPPMPTLIPALDPLAISSTPNTLTSGAPQAVVQPTLPPKKVVLTKPKRAAKRPAPVTRTRSSK